MIDLAFEVRRGGFHLEAELRSDAQATGLFGPSGCGKTTILHAVAGILTPRAGRISICGRVFWDSASGVNLRPEQRRLGMVFQENRLFPHLDVQGNLLFGYQRTPAAERRLHLEEIASLLGLEALLGKPARELSGGEARRVAIGRALLTSPDALILDEPLAGLDRRLRDRILAYLIRLKRKLDLRLIYVSHSFSDLAELADWMAIVSCTEEGGVRRSRIVRTGRPIDLLDDVGNLASAGPLETLLRGEVVAVNRASGYATVRAGGIEVHAPLEGQTAGSRAVVTIRADEVILAVGEIPRLSSRNVWTGRVSKLHRLETRTVVEVEVGPAGRGQKILAEVTEDAIRDLGLDTGSEVHALIKTRSLRVTSLPVGDHIEPRPPD